MKRLESLGSISFLTVTLSLVFHLLAMSYTRWSNNNCNTCNDTDIVGSWCTSLRQRCYETSMGSIFLKPNDTTTDLLQNSFTTDICIPNQYLFANAPQYVNVCLAEVLANPDTVCSIGTYDKTACRCE